MKVSNIANEMLRITAPANTGNYRTGTIKVIEDNFYRVITITQAGNCATCNGNGTISCATCGGTGGVGFGMMYSQCVWCGGNGKLRCSACGGNGYKN